MTSKLIKDMDEETWRKFIAFCKLKGVTASDQLEDILNEFLQKNLGKLMQAPKRGGKR